jgi:hypothetical protein
MALPVAANQTCDVYRHGNSPPATPDVQGVKCFLSASYFEGLEHGEKDSIVDKFTHWMMVDLNTDIRDDYDAGTLPRSGNFDTIYVPNQNGPFIAKVIFVERKGYGTGNDYKKVYLQRNTYADWTPPASPT